jgi:hypothetical protein
MRLGLSIEWWTSLPAIRERLTICFKHFSQEHLNLKSRYIWQDWIPTKLIKLRQVQALMLENWTNVILCMKPPLKRTSTDSPIEFQNLFLPWHVLLKLFLVLTNQWPGRTGGWLQTNRLRLINNRLKFRGVYRTYPNFYKGKTRKMSTCNRLDLEILGSQPTKPKYLPGHFNNPK